MTLPTKRNSDLEGLEATQASSLTAEIEEGLPERYQGVVDTPKDNLPASISTPNPSRNTEIIREIKKIEKSNVKPDKCGVEIQDPCNGTPELAKITVDLGTEPFVNDTPANEWICRPPIKTGHVQKKLRRSEMFKERTIKTLDIATKLLLTKLEKGLVAQRREVKEQEQEPLDMFEVRPSMFEAVEISVFKEARMNRRFPNPPVAFTNVTTIGTQGMSDAKALHRPISKAEITAFVHEPDTHHFYFLRKLGAINDEGELMEGLHELAELEHFVKKAVVEEAVEVMGRRTLKRLHRLSFQEQVNENEKRRTATLEANLRRSHVHHVLVHELNKNHATRKNLKNKCTSESDLAGRSFMKVNEVVHRLSIRLEMKRSSSSSFSEKLDSEHSLFEILPHEFRSSFEDEPVICQKTPIHGLWDNANDEDETEESEVKMTAQFAFTPEELLGDGFEDCSSKPQYPFSSQWDGDYPKYAMDRIKDLDDRFKHFEPKNENDFYQTFRRLELQMYDRVEQVLEDFKKHEEVTQKPRMGHHCQKKF